MTGRGKIARGCPLAIVADGAPGSSGGGQTVFIANDSSKLLNQIVLSRDPVGANSKLAPVSQLAAHKQNILSLERFDPEDGASETLIATGGKDGNVVVWKSQFDPSKGQSNASIVTTLSGHGAASRDRVTPWFWAVTQRVAEAVTSSY